MLGHVQFPQLAQAEIVLINEERSIFRVLHDAMFLDVNGARDKCHAGGDILGGNVDGRKSNCSIFREVIAAIILKGRSQRLFRTRHVPINLMKLTVGPDSFHKIVAW